MADDLKQFAEHLADSMAEKIVHAQAVATERADWFTRLKKNAANLFVSAAGALVAFMLVAWFGESRDSSRKAEELSNKASNTAAVAVAADASSALVKAAKKESELAQAMAANNQVKVDTLLDVVAKLTLTAGAPAREPSAEELKAAREAIQKELDTAIYRQQQLTK